MEQRSMPGLVCSFCAKDDRQLAYLIAGPDGVHICDECIDLCGELVVGKGIAKTALPTGADVHTMHAALAQAQATISCLIDERDRLLARIRDLERSHS